MLYIHVIVWFWFLGRLCPAPLPRCDEETKEELKVEEVLGREFDCFLGEEVASLWDEGKLF